MTAPLPPFFEVLYDRFVKYAEGEMADASNAKLDPDDVILSSGAKSGTTWSQQILHSLRSRGDMDFEDIHDVSPYLETFVARGVAPPKTPFHPEIYKSHNNYELCPHGNRTIVVTRDPNDAALSTYHYEKGWFFEEGQITLDEFIEFTYVVEFPKSVRGVNADQLSHLASWYPHRKDPNVLWLHYEDLKADLVQCIRIMADFIGVDSDDAELMEITQQRASLEFMRKHVSKYNSHKLKPELNARAGLPRDAGLGKGSTPKVRSGQVNESKEVFSEKTKAMLKQKWMELMKPLCGYDSYAEMRSAVNAELGRVFSSP